MNTTDFGGIDVLNRAQFVDDAFALARASAIDYTIPLSLGQLYLSQETDYIPLYSFLRQFEYIDKMFSGTDNHQGLQVRSLES